MLKLALVGPMGALTRNRRAVSSSAAVGDLALSRLGRSSEATVRKTPAAATGSCRDSNKQKQLITQMLSATIA